MAMIGICVSIKSHTNFVEVFLNEIILTCTGLDIKSWSLTREAFHF